MEYRRLGSSGLTVSDLCMGTMTFGLACDEALSFQIMDRAFDAGIDFYDTAEVYPVPPRADLVGVTEEIVGRWMRTKSRDAVTIATKVTGPRHGWFAAPVRGQRCFIDRHQILKSCDESLRRLHTDYIDLYQIHWPEPDDEIEEGWAECARLRAAGKVGWIGVSNFNVAQLERAAAIAPVTSLQPPYSLLRREIEGEILPWCQAHGVGVLAYSPMASGLLTGSWSPERFRDLPADDWRKEKNPLFQEPRFSAHLAFVECLRSLAADRGVAVGALALAWVLGQAAVTAAIVGARRPGQLGDLVAAADLRLLPDEREAITALVPV